MVYLLLALAGITAAWLAARQRGQLPQLAATLAVAAAGLIQADWIAFGWFNRYSYQPHLARNPRVDCSLGEIPAEVLFAPSLTALTATRLPNLYGAVLCTFAVTACEELLLRYGQFSHNGWQSWYTALLFPGYFLLVGKVRTRLERFGLANRTNRLVVRGALLFVTVGLVTLALRPFGLVETNLHLVPTRVGNQSLGRYLTYPTIFLPVGYWVLAGGPRQRWWRLGVGLLAFGALNVALMISGFQRYRPPYTWYLDALGQAAALWLACAASDLLQRHWSSALARSS